MTFHAYRGVTTAAALDIARRWYADATDIVELRAGENSVWRVTSRGVPYALRLTTQSHRTEAQIAAELAFIDHLSAGGLQVARPLTTPGGVRLLDVASVVSPNEPTYAVLFEWLGGRHFVYNSPDIDRPLFRLWGETMARLHQLSVTFAADANARPEWHDDRVAGCSLPGTAVSGDVATLRDELAQWLHSMPPEPAHYGMVHGDFERTNFVLDGERIGIFDFDDCCRHWFSWDIACALWVFRNETAVNRARFLAWFMEGYASVREPDAPRMERFSDLVRLRTIALLLHRLRTVGGLASAADRDWIARTETWLHAPWRWE